MSVFQGILLGLLQGFTEFLPVSSSGHLAITQSLFGLGDVPILFDVFLHVATLLAVVIYFRRKLLSLIRSFVRLFRRRASLTASQLDARRGDAKYILAIVLSTFVTGVLGLLFSSFVEDLGLRLVCAGFLVTAALLAVSSLVRRKAPASPRETPTWRQALAIGFAQGIGTLPGISRSGATISASLLAGLSREAAGEYSFIVSIPAILGAFVLELRDLGEVSNAVGAGCVFAGCAAAFASGFVCLVFLMRVIKRGRLEYFAFYLVPAGILGLIFLN